MARTCWLALAILVSLAPPSADAAFIVIVNTTESTVRLTIGHAQSEARPYALEPNEVRRIPVGRSPELSFESGGKSSHFRIAPYTAYAFAKSPAGVTLQGIELAAPLPKPDDVPEAPPTNSRPFVLAVRIMADDADARAQAAWEKVFRARVAAVSKILERECGVTLKVADAGGWLSNPQARTAAALLTDFENKVPPDGSHVAIGFSSRLMASPAEGDRCGPGATHGPLHGHILVSESALTTEAERVELLAHGVAHLLGAAHSPDPLSLMRPTMGDGKARSAKFRVALDPLNALAVGIWVEEMRTGELKEWGDLRPPARTRLIAVYKTIARALPDDPIAKESVAHLERLAPVAREAAADGQVLTAKQQAVRKVVRAVAIRAADLNRKPEPERPKGDELTTELVRTAASVAATEEEKLQPAALLIGLGLALDHSAALRDNPLTRNFCRAVESDAEFRERTAVLGSPTVRGRRDLCQHFVVSAALAELLDPVAAEAAGLLKERLDMGKASGFSFADLAADLAGIAFAREVRRDSRVVARASLVFEVEEFVPDVAGLAEGLSKQKFEADYGSESDPRFRKALEDVRKRVRELPGYNR